MPPPDAGPAAAAAPNSVTAAKESIESSPSACCSDNSGTSCCLNEQKQADDDACCQTAPFTFGVSTSSHAGEEPDQRKKAADTWYSGVRDASQHSGPAAFTPLLKILHMLQQKTPKSDAILLVGVVLGLLGVVFSFLSSIVQKP